MTDIDDIAGAEDPAKALIIAEELSREDTIEVDEESETPIFIQKKGFEKTTQFTPQGDDIEHDQLPIHGKGKLTNFLVVADSPNYDVQVVVDDREVVNDSHEDLEALSNELEHISAYSSGDKNVTVVDSYPFEDSLHIYIRPRERMEFKRVRVEGVAE